MSLTRRGLFGAVAALAARRVGAPRYPMYAAVGERRGGERDDSAAVQRAIDMAYISGCSTVYFPAGTYTLTGP